MPRAKAKQATKKVANRDPDGLLPRQRLFVMEYLKDQNATAAIKRAGYKCKNDNVAAVDALQMLRNPKIARVVRRALAAMCRKLETSAERTVQEIVYLAQSDPADVFDFDGPTMRLKPANEIPEHARRSMASIELDENGQVKKIRFWDKNSALDKLGRIQKLLTTQTQVNVSGQVNHVHADLLDLTNEQRLDELQRLAEAIRQRRVTATNGTGATTAPAIAGPPVVAPCGSPAESISVNGS